MVLTTGFLFAASSPSFFRASSLFFVFVLSLGFLILSFLGLVRSGTSEPIFMRRLATVLEFIHHPGLFKHSGSFREVSPLTAGLMARLKREQEVALSDGAQD